MTAIDPAVIDAAARQLHEGAIRQAKRDRDWDLGDIAKADAARDALRGALTALSEQLAADEALVDYTYTQKSSIGPRKGVSLRLNLLAATNQRFWFVLFEDGALGSASPIPFDAVTTETKRLAI